MARKVERAEWTLVRSLFHSDVVFRLCTYSPLTEGYIFEIERRSEVFRPSTTDRSHAVMEAVVDVFPMIAACVRAHVS